MKRYGAYFPFLLMLLFFVTSDVLAANKVSASAGLRLAYHDNLFLEKTNKDDDLVTHVMGQLGIAAERPKLELNVDYRLNFIFYQDHDNLDETDIKDAQRLTSSLRLGSWAGFSLLLEGLIDRVAVDESAKVNQDSDAVNKTNRNTFRVTPSYERALTPTLLLEAAYQFEDISHTNAAADERTSHTVSSTLTKALSKRTSLYVTGLYRKVDAEGTVDYSRNEALLGGKYALSPKALIDARAGIAQVDQENDNEKKLAVWHVSLIAPAGNMVSTTASASQKLRHAEVDGLFRSRLWELSASYEGRLGGEARLFHAADDYVRVHREDKRTGGSIGANLQLTPLLAAEAGVQYTRTRLQPVSEDKDTYRVTASVNYDRPHFTVSGAYSYQEENSNITLNSYVSNVIFVELTVRI